MIAIQTIDIRWGDFWGYIEAAVGVIVVSITAFRSLLGTKSLQRQQQRLPPYTRRKIFMPWKTTSTEESDIDPRSLPAIPGPTLTGMRTFINGQGDSRSSLDNDEEEEIVAAARRKAIKVTHSLSTHSEYNVRNITYIQYLYTIHHTDIMLPSRHR